MWGSLFKGGIESTPHFYMKTLIGVNCLENINSQVYASHIDFFLKTKKAYPDDEFLFFTPYRMSIDNMRNMAAKIALEHNCDYLMFIDDDVLVHPETYKSLREADKDIIMALTYIRSHPYHPMFFREERTFTDENGKIKKEIVFYEDYLNKVDEKGIVDVEAIGFSCALIKMELVKHLNPPYFVTGAGHTEDVYFCLKCKYTFDNVSIAVDTKVPTSHLIMQSAVTFSNVEELRKEHDIENPIGKERFDRVKKIVAEMNYEA
jgi:hypothetical protein